MNKLLLLPLLFVISLMPAVSQNKNSIWYFGANAGLDFNSGSPVAISGGQVNTQEGCATACDANGAILFYSDGVTVWNKLHAIMPNGMNLNGGQSSTQAVVIVPLPGSNSLYYVFTTPQTGSGDFEYSIVDITLQGGLGDVTSTKNVSLYTSTTEKLTICANANNTGYWIISHKMSTDEFYAYELTSAGLNTVPVISIAGSVINGINWAGTMKASPSGDKIAMIMEADFTCELFDFNNNTGAVSFQGILTNPAFNYTYGCEFSPDGTRLYIASDPPGLNAELWQFDLQAGNFAAINASATLIGTGSGFFYFGTLQTAPDNKIYVARENQLHVGCIQNPNAAGAACNYLDTAVYLGGALCQLGLPNSSTVSAVSFQFICLGDSTIFDVVNITGIGGVQWSFDDPASGAANTSSLFNPVHVFTAAGLYNVQLIRYYVNGNIDTVFVSVNINNIPFINLGNDTTICTGSSITLQAGSHQEYLWHDNSTAASYLVTAPGVYAVQVMDGSCYATDSISIAFAPCSFPSVSFASSDTLVCEKSCLDFFDLSSNNPASWQWYFPNAQPDTSTLPNPVNICFNSYGTFDVTLVACNAAGCDTLSIPAFITIFQSPAQPSVTFSNDTLYCNAQALSYQWFFNSTAMPGETDPFLVNLQPGSYYCVITDSNDCPASSTVFVISDVNDMALHNSIFTHDNPVKDVLNIYFNIPVGDAFISIHDITGRKMLESNHHFNQSAELAIDVSAIASGNYFMRMDTGHGIFFSRLLVAR